MIRLKKTILTLALLIAATTQAWATDYLYLDISSNGTTATIYYGYPGDKPYLEPYTGWTTNGNNSWDNARYKIRSDIKTVSFDESCQNFKGTSLRSLFFYFQHLTTINGLDNLCTDDVEDISEMFEYCKSLTTLDLSSLNTAKVTNMCFMFAFCSNLTTLDLSSFNTAKVENMQAMFSSCEKLETIYVSDDWSTAKVTDSDDMFDGCNKLPGYKSTNPKDKQMAALTEDGGYLTFKETGTPVDVAWNATTKTGTIAAMPSGNVRVKVKYYPQATADDGAVTAATSAQAQTDAPLVTVDNAKLTGATALKFCVTTTNSAPGYDDTGWTTTVPTAKTFNAAGGTAYVWYYPVGNDDTDPTKIYSDGDICATALEVTVAAAPTYDVSLNKTGLATGEPDKWKAKIETVTTEVNLGEKDLEGVTKGETVTVTYTGTRKVIGVKAEKTDTKYLKWDDSQQKLVPTKIPATAIKVENVNDYVTWAAGTYLVEGDVTISGAISLSGDVVLIIKDGAKLNVNQIDGYNSSLSVYGQINMSGELNVVTSDFDAIVSMTALNIHSCKVNAISSKSGRGGIFKISEVNVYGGSVVAENTGGSNGYGILDAPLNIYGGEVKAVCKASSGSSSFGISGVHGETVTVYGGKLWAECAVNKAIYSNVTLTKGEGFNGKIETSDNGTD